MTISHKISLGVGVTVLGLLAAFVVINREPTEVNFIVGTFVVSRALLVLGFFAAGFLTGWLTHSVFRIRRRSSAASDQGETRSESGDGE